MSVPTTIQLPDYMAAIKNFLRDQPLVQAFTSEIEFRDVGTDEELEHPIRNLITLTALEGFPLHPGLLQRPWFEVRCWGSNGYEAMRGYRIVYSVLTPPQGYKVGFTRNGCHVYDIGLVRAALSMTDNHGWESRSAVFSATIREIPEL